MKTDPTPAETARLPDPSAAPTVEGDRFFIDHGMIHDRVTGKHVTTGEDSVFEDGINACCALLNSLQRENEGLKAAEHRVCAGCGTSHPDSDYAGAGPPYACCPERKMLTAQEWAARAEALEKERDGLLKDARQLDEVLSDPNAVHLNMLRGTIAKPSMAQIKHLYGADLTSERDVLKARVAELEEGYRKLIARFRRAVIAGGSDEEYADIAVADDERLLSGQEGR